MGFLRELIDPNARELKRLRRRVEQINALEPEFRDRPLEELRQRIEEIREEIEAADSIEEQEKLMDRHLNEVFAIVRETARRTIGLRHYDVQLMAGIVLHEGRIAEQKTGEGKTLSATCAVVLNALTGRGVHVVTVNDYLARRDAEWMGPIYHTLGLTVGVLQHNLDKEARKRVYNSDIVYGTNHEFGFDYLRDNMVIELSQRVQRDLYYAIVDEVDSILIDEARTPLIISGTADEDTSIYYEVDRAVRKLKGKDVTGEDRPKDIFTQLEEKRKKKDLDITWDYEYDRKNKTVALTWRGIEKLEKHFGIDNLYDFEHSDLLQKIHQALKAHSLFHNEQEYIVKDGQIVIVDEFTGRLMWGRRYNEGLHQAIEAKEGLIVQGESQTLATITLQNFFRLYHKLAGMTGTAKTEEDEFRQIYGMDVVVIPTNKPVIRKDLPDAVYKNQEAKWEAIVREIEQAHARGQPVLVGTVSVEKSEMLSRMLKKRGIPHEVLNAKHHEREAYIIAQAGRSGAVTIATNMAGRGTDIVLGGNPEYLAKEKAQEEARKLGLNPEESEEDRKHYEEIFKRYLEEFKRECAEDQKRVIEAGGLYVIGTERHEARRIDNQLRGRSGRQGDPGMSKFFLALDDDLLKMFAMDMVERLMDLGGHDPSIPLESPLLTRTIERAQKKVEGRNFEIRKYVLEYDNVVNRQREVIYAERDRILKGEDIEDEILGFIEGAVEAWVSECVREGEDGHVFVDYQQLYDLIVTNLPVRDFDIEQILDLGPEPLIEKLTQIAQELYREKEAEVLRIQQELGVEGPNWMRELERVVMLRTIDRLWIEHLNAMEQLREGVRLRGYGQIDPIVVYSKEAFEMFEQLKAEIQKEVVSTLFRAQINVEPLRRTLERRRVFRERGDNYAEAARQPEYGVAEEIRELRRQEREKAGAAVAAQDRAAEVRGAPQPLNRRQRRMLRRRKRR